jgi:precorrin-2 dehydrogenase / sirohydrochlorin ferrochelatase
MSKVSDAYRWEEMCDLTAEDMDNLLRFYAPDQVPPIDVLKSMRGNTSMDKIDLFDGSFGFSVGA